MRRIERPSPNHDGRGDAPIDMLVLHYTGMQSAEGALDRLTDPAAKVSAHYTIDEDGTVYVHVAEDRRAWHAGVSSWRGRNRCNDFSIGIELEGADDRAFEDAQYAMLADLTGALRAAYAISDVVGHSDIAPERRTDPGPCFDWARFRKLAGI